eukprot:4224717-Pleurochrysis_carterae.AAC.2
MLCKGHRAAGVCVRRLSRLENTRISNLLDQPCAAALCSPKRRAIAEQERTGDRSCNELLSYRYVLCACVFFVLANV